MQLAIPSPYVCSPFMASYCVIVLYPGGGGFSAFCHVSALSHACAVCHSFQISALATSHTKDVRAILMDAAGRALARLHTKRLSGPRTYDTQRAATKNPLHKFKSIVLGTSTASQVFSALGGQSARPWGPTHDSVDRRSCCAGCGAPADAIVSSSPTTPQTGGEAPLRGLQLRAMPKLLAVPAAVRCMHAS